MPKELRLLLLTLVILSFKAQGQQEKYWVYFTDKSGVSFDPYEYFDPGAIERREREHLNLYDLSDYPVKQEYIDSVIAGGANVTGLTRWFNAAAVLADTYTIEKLSKYSFVRSIEKMNYEEVVLNSYDQEFDFNAMFNEKLLREQVQIMEQNKFEQAGLSGRGVRIAVFDGGFKGFTNDNAFKKLIENNQIRATYDFVKNTKFVFSFHNHGSHVMSCIAGRLNDKPMGCASDAQFLLARTEQVLSERKIEEENWLQSLEWADKNGADIVNSSLGYTDRFYFRKDMDGQTSIISKAANKAASKGILVVNSAGNEGGSYWETVAAPADADSVLTVGGINPRTLLHSDFSSYGPTSDKRLKPNLSAFGEAIGSSNQRSEVAVGTSFSSPLVAGFAACVKQLHPEWTVAELHRELQKSGHLYPYFDYAHGYGIPQAGYFTDSIKKNIEPTIRFRYKPEREEISIVLINDTLQNTDTPADSAVIKNPLRNMDYVYVHGEGEDHTLDFYEVYDVSDELQEIILRDKWSESVILRAHRNGYTIEKTIEELIEESEQ